MFWYPNAFPWRTIFMASLAVAVSGSAAFAQEGAIGAPAAGSGQVASPEVVIINPGRPGPARSTIGAPIEDVLLSASVRTDDLNPTVPADMLELHYRVKETARRLCDRLDFRYPIGVPDEYHCIQNAVERTSNQIETTLRYGSAPAIENP